MYNISDYLEKYATEITPYEFYREIFPQGELERKGVYENGKYNGIAVALSSDGDIKRYTVTDELSELDIFTGGKDFCLMSPISYAGKSRKNVNARFLYALAVDVDGIRQRELDGYPEGIQNLFWQFDGNGPSNYLPKPTFIVMSGTGLHIYYVFERAIPLFPNIVEQLQRYKKRLTWQLWTQGVTDLQDAVQYESLFQGFRIPGTVTKTGARARAFRIDEGKKVTMEYMNRFVPEKYRTGDFRYKSKLTLEEAREKYPEWYEKRIVERRKRGTWQCKRDLYDWWKGKIYEKTEDGHRYWAVMALATYAKKCGIEEEELVKDALGMVGMLDGRGKRPDNPFTVEDVQAALEAYNDSYITYPRDVIAARTGIFIEKNKRNGRRQEVHIKTLNAMRKFRRDELGEDEYKNNGRPKGSGTAEQKVKAWRELHPDGKKIDCERETGLSRHTILKWWGGRELIEKNQVL